MSKTVANNETNENQLHGFHRYFCHVVLLQLFFCYDELKDCLGKGGKGGDCYAKHVFDVCMGGS